MEHPPVLGNRVRDGNGINDGLVCWICVYAGSSWTLQQTKTDLRVIMNKKALSFIVSDESKSNRPGIPPFNSIGNGAE